MRVPQADNREIEEILVKEQKLQLDRKDKFRTFTVHC
jgi:hypothetical protein